MAIRQHADSPKELLGRARQAEVLKVQVHDLRREAVEVPADLGRVEQEVVGRILQPRDAQGFQVVEAREARRREVRRHQGARAVEAGHLHDLEVVGHREAHFLRAHGAGRRRRREHRPGLHREVGVFELAEDAPRHISLKDLCVPGRPHFRPEQ